MAFFFHFMYFSVNIKKENLFLTWSSIHDSNYLNCLLPAIFLPA